MVREDVKFKLRAVRQHIEGNMRTEDICEVFGISERTLRRWCRRYKEEGVEGLRQFYSMQLRCMRDSQVHGV